MIAVHQTFSDHFSKCPTIYFNHVIISNTFCHILLSYILLAQFLNINNPQSREINVVGFGFDYILCIHQFLTKSLRICSDKLSGQPQTVILDFVKIVCMISTFLIREKLTILGSAVCPPMSTTPDS